MNQSDEKISETKNEECLNDTIDNNENNVETTLDQSKTDEINYHTAYLPKTNLKFEKEIRQILAAYDDGTQVSNGTIQILDDIMSSFVVNTTKRAATLGKRGKITTNDILYVVKKDKIKYYRAKELLKLNEQLKKAKKLAESNIDFDF